MSLVVGEVGHLRQNAYMSSLNIGKHETKTYKYKELKQE
jgi:hypothetical protein